MSHINHRVRMGVIGVGVMGNYHLKNLYNLSDVEVVAICDIDEQRLEDLSARYQVPGVLDYRELLDQVDAVSIATPTHTHYWIVRDFLEHEVDVLVEKPMTRSLEEAKELIRIKEEQGLVLEIGHVERFNPGVHVLKEYIRDPIYIESRRQGPFTERTSDIGVILDLMLHDLDIILDLVASPIEEINAIGISVYSDFEDIANVQLSFENGCIANLTANRVSPQKERKLKVIQDSTLLSLDYMERDLVIYRAEEFDYPYKQEGVEYTERISTERISVDSGNPLLEELKYFLASVRSRQDGHDIRPISNSQDDLTMLELVSEILERTKIQKIKMRAKR
ncbi:MAG: Gfo/Idh/MocA family protein [Candidatus Bipolaricaulia bacterium]